MTLLLVVMLAPLPSMAGNPIHLDDDVLNGHYIGKYIAYLSHQEVIDALMADSNLDDAFKEKVRTGDLVSDETVTVDLTWTNTGYSARFAYVDGRSAAQRFDVGVKDLTKPDIAAGFIPSHQRIVMLRSDHRPYWLRFTVRNDGHGPIVFFLELDKHLFEYINLYAPSDDGAVMQRLTLATPLNQRQIQYKNFVFKLSAKKGETTYYLLVQSWNRLTSDSVPLRIWSPENFIRHASDDGLYRGIITGLFLLIFFYNIFIYASDRDPAYLYLSMVSLCQMILEMSVSGLGFNYLWSDHPMLVTQAIFQTTALVIAFNLLFYRSFINIARYTPKLDRALLVLSFFFFGSALCFHVLPRSFLPVPIAFLFSVDHLYSLPVLIPAVMAVKEKNPAGWFALIGIFFYYLGLLKFILTGSDIIPYGPLHYLPIKGLSFLIIMTLGLTHKFSKIKKALLDLNINLERRVYERTEALNEANEKLKEMDQVKTRFFTNISHEFRTPLTLITAPIDSLLKGDYGQLPKPGEAVVRSMKRNADRLLNLIGDLLDFSKIEAGKMDVQWTDCNFAQLISLWISEIDSNAASHGITIDYRDKTDGLQTRVDPDLMEKAFLNLLSNAIKFNRPEGENRIEVVLEKSPTAFTFSVQDTGVGIPGDQLEGIFDRFSQVDSSCTRRYEGTGIGLSLTREIVQLHHGSIVVESSMGKGSKFTITIPLVACRALRSDGAEFDDSTDASWATGGCPGPVYSDLSASELKNGDNTAASGQSTILIVEDHADMRAYLSDILSKHYRTVTASNGKQALAVIEKETVDLVLSDLMMPEMDGFELTRQLRSMDRYEGMPILMLTAKSGNADKLDGFDKGANDYITKPFSAVEVLARIRSHLKFKMLRDKLLRANLNLKGQKKILTDTSKIKIRAVKEFLDENYVEDISREDLAVQAEMSADHLGKMFKQYTGLKISDYINRKRVAEAARQLAETESKIITIAFEVGFGSLRTFNQAFRDHMGESPSSYRKKNRRTYLPTRYSDR